MLLIDAGLVASLVGQVVNDAAHADPLQHKAYAPPTEDWVARFARCVINHESASAGVYQARNPISSASGAYQFVDGTWRSYSKRAGVPFYRRAYLAPKLVQDKVFRYVVEHGGARNWKGTHCGYGT